MVEVVEARRSGRLARMPPAALVGLGCLVAIVLASALIVHESGLHGDDVVYQLMAAKPLAPHTFPYAFRIGVPWLAHALHAIGFTYGAAFAILAWLATAATGAALYALLREFEIDARLAAALALAFAVSPILLLASLRNGRSVDPASILVLTLGCLFIVRRSKLALCITMLLGVTIHESTLFLGPLAYAVWAERLFDRRAVIDAASVCALPVIAYVALRSSVTAVGEGNLPQYHGSFLHARLETLKGGFENGAWRVQLRRIAAVFGLLWLIAPFALGSLRFARRGVVLVFLCALSMSYATDWDRLLFLAAPVVYVASAHVINHRRRLALVTLSALVALDLGYAIYMQVHGVRYGVDAVPPAAYRVY